MLFVAAFAVPADLIELADCACKLSTGLRRRISTRTWLGSARLESAQLAAGRPTEMSQRKKINSSQTTLTGHPQKCDQILTLSQSRCYAACCFPPIRLLGAELAWREAPRLPLTPNRQFQSGFRIYKRSFSCSSARSIVWAIYRVSKLYHFRNYLVVQVGARQSFCALFVNDVGGFLVVACQLVC